MHGMLQVFVAERTWCVWWNWRRLGNLTVRKIVCDAPEPG